MNESHLREYLKAWSDHCKGDAADADSMCGAASDDIQYGDINLESPFKGHQGIRDMCQLATTILHGAEMVIHCLLQDDDAWATQWTLKGKEKTCGRAYAIKGTSWGALDRSGKVSSHLDYWNPMHFEAQTGVSLFPSD